MHRVTNKSLYYDEVQQYGIGRDKSLQDNERNVTKFTTKVNDYCPSITFDGNVSKYSKKDLILLSTKNQRIEQYGGYDKYGDH